MYSDLPEALASFQYALAGEPSMKIFEGRGFAFETIYSPLRDQKGDIIGVTGVGIDLTERKWIEAALSKSEKDLKEAQRLAKIGSWDWDAITDTITWSEEYYHIYGFDPTQRPAGYEDHLKVYTPESAAQLDAAVKRNMQTGESYELDLELARMERPRRWITARSETKRNAQGQIIGLYGTAQDITERKQAEENIINSLKEKENLLKEIHHRVKNNLQIISSLLYLQSKKVTDTRSLEVFNESQNRIRSMVMIHEQLYKSGDLANINFEKYIHDMASSLALLYGSKPVTYNIHAAGVYLGVNQAIPCGLMINELVSNALKHAFPPGKQGQIDIDFITDKSNYLTLTVKDNGAGFPKNLDFRHTTSLGLQIINKLVEQLGGTIELQSDAGTEFKIRFPNQNKI
jgi:two-component sensor histidine kinase/PAS domain-containing protein